MDRIDNMLQDSASELLTPAVKHALKFTRQIMNKYYSRTDLSNVYRIAMGMSDVLIVCRWLTSLVVLHPQMKLKYFQSYGWKQEWIDTVRDITTEEFSKYNKVSELQNASAPSAADDLMDFGDIPMDNIAEVSELDTYLAQPVEKVRDVIAWWWDHRAVFPKLSSMALDYLSAPGMSLGLHAIPCVSFYQQHQPLSRGSFHRAYNSCISLATDFLQRLFVPRCAWEIGVGGIFCLRWTLLRQSKSDEANESKRMMTMVILLCRKLRSDSSM